MYLRLNVELYMNLYLSTFLLIQIFIPTKLAQKAILKDNIALHISDTLFYMVLLLNTLQ